MSSIRAGGFRGRGRGGQTNATSAAPRGASSTFRGRGASNAPRQDSHAPRRGQGQTARGGGGHAAVRGRGAQRSNPFAPQQPATARKPVLDGPISSGTWKEREEQLQRHRVQEKRDAIAHGLMSDPDKRMRVSEAITIVGTCPSMCPEEERVRRVIRNEIWDAEKDTKGEPIESRMVKAFRRSAAGDEVQIPSDLRPPAILKRTCDYLFHDLIGNEPLPQVHHFVWDRTRAIRNDFSIQQLSKADDLRVAIDCYERIARFHIMSLHQLALPERPYSQYDSQQEREQLDRTLLSLMQYYDDSRGRIELDNEAEFRAYCVVFQLRDPTPDLEDRVQSWPSTVSADRQVQTAMELYAAACSIKYPEGPIQDRTHVIARQDWEAFWTVVHSRKVSYLMACVAEIYFMLIREMVLNALVRTARVGKVHGIAQPITVWTVDELWGLFNFDEEDQLKAFCGRWGLDFQERTEDGQEYLDIKHVAGRALPSSQKDGPTQLKSSLVEEKRHRRTLPAIIDGLNVRQAKENSMVGEEELEEEMEDVAGDFEEDEGTNVPGDVDTVDDPDPQSLFVPEKKWEVGYSQSAVTNNTTPFGSPFASAVGAFGQRSGFGAPSQPSGINPFQSSLTAPAQDQPSPEQRTPFNFLGGTTSQVGAPAKSPAATSPFASAAVATATASTNPFSFASTTASAANTVGTSQGLFSTATPNASPFGQSPTTDSLFSNPFAPKTTSTSFFEAGPSMAEGPSPIKSEAQENSAGPSTFFTTTSDHEPPVEKSSSNMSGRATLNPIAPSDTNLKAPGPQQTHVAAPSTLPHNNQNGNIANPGAQSPTRRPSSWEDSKPKKPSPLAHSFTATEDNAASRAPKQAIASFEEQPGRKHSLTQSVLSKAADANIKPPVVTPPATGLVFEAADWDFTLSRLARELCECPSNGIFKQFVDFHVKKAVRAAQEKVVEEGIQARLDILRTVILQRKWSRRWREIIRRRRVEERRRKQRERRERKLHGSDSKSTLGHRSLRGSKAPLKDSLSGPLEKQEALDSLLQLTRKHRNPELDSHAKAGSKRSASNHEPDGSPASDFGHKRFKSMDHIDHRGRIAKVPPTSSPNADILKRSSFLAFSLASDAPNRASTTRSTYFRMKALGIGQHSPAADASYARDSKRPRSESFDADSRTKSTQPRSPSVLRSSLDAGSDMQLMRPPSSRSVSSRMTEEDDALFSRLRAAREALQESETFMQESVEKEEARNRSLSRSLSSNESPSMARARAEARLRAPDLSGSISGRDVPTYRLRQSRFLSREEQAQAIERAHEMRASRTSRNPSRAESSTDNQQPKESAAPGKTAFGAPLKAAAPNRGSSIPPVNGHLAKASAPLSVFTAQPTSHAAAKDSVFGFGASTGSPRTMKPASLFSGFGPLAPAIQTPQDDYAAQTVPSNPFTLSSSYTPAPFNHLQAAISIQPTQHIPAFEARPQNSNSAPVTYSQAPVTAPPAVDSLHDHTIAPAQIDNALAHTFGQPVVGGSPFAHSFSHGSPTPSHLNSCMPSQAASEAISLLSDDEEDGADTGFGQQGLYGNVSGVIRPNAYHRSPTQSFDQEAEAEILHNAHAQLLTHSSAAVPGQIDADDDAAAAADEATQKHWTAQAGTDKDGTDYDSFDGEVDGVLPDSYQYSDEDAQEEYDEAAKPNGVPHGDYYSDDGEQGDREEDTDDEDLDDGEGEEESDEEDDEEDEEDYNEATYGGFVPMNHAYNRHAQAAKLEKSPYLQDVGNTAEEAIELDSD